MLGFTIDTIGIFAKAELIANFNSQELGLTIIRRGKFKSWEEGYYKNFRIKYHRDYGIYFSGSISNYYKGHTSILQYDELYKAIEKLGDSLGINLHSARLYRVDLALNIETNNPVSQYSNTLFTYLAHFIRLEQDDGVRFETKNKVIAIYNKTKELCEKKQIKIHQQILRIEFRVLKKTFDVFKIKEMKVEHLYQPSVYILLVSTFFKYYQKIKKQHIISAEVNAEYITPTIFKSLLMNKGIELHFHTEEEAYTKIEGWSREGKFKNPMDKSRCKKMITDAFRNPKNTEIHPLVKEINSKVESNCKHTIEELRKKEVNNE